MTKQILCVASAFALAALLAAPASALTIHVPRAVIASALDLPPAPMADEACPFRGATPLFPIADLLRT